MSRKLKGPFFSFFLFFLFFFLNPKIKGILKHSSPYKLRILWYNYFKMCCSRKKVWLQLSLKQLVNLWTVENCRFYILLVKHLADIGIKALLHK